MRSRIVVHVYYVPTSKKSTAGGNGKRCTQIPMVFNILMID